MFKDVSVSLNLYKRDLKEILEIDFDKLKSDIEILAQQPYVEVFPCYKDKEIDYEEGFRSIDIMGEGRPFGFSYSMSDRANVKENSRSIDFVGRKNYTQEKVDGLRNQNP